MATSVVYSANAQTQDDNLETYRLVWLDLDINKSSGNQDVQQQLRAIINHLTTFEDTDACRKYIERSPIEDRFVLIVSGQISRELLSQIHQHKQVSSIYVHCMNTTTVKEWANDLIKINAVAGHLDELISRIKHDQNDRMQVEEPLPINIFTTNNDVDQSTTGINGQFIDFQLLTDVLLRMKPTVRSNDELIALCQKEYRINPVQLAIVHEFEQDYSENRALWWYTRESFVYKMLNKALRVQNIDVLFLFRTFMHDIQRQLKLYKCESPIQAYRGQVMGKNELERLRRSTGDFISINSLFSTSTNRQKAIIFLNRGEISADMQRVLFEIDADPRIVSNKPFAEISRQSAFANESEVLFMLGSIFRLTDIHFSDDNRIWIIRMTSCSDEDRDMRHVCLHLKKEYAEEEITSLRSLGMVLRKMAKYDLAEKYLRRYLQELSADDPMLASTYQDLGLVAIDRGDHNTSLTWYQKSLETYMCTRPFDLVNIAIVHINIGEFYGKEGDYNRALESYNKSMSYFKKANDKNNPKLAIVYNNMGIIYRQQEKESLALAFHEKSLAIKQQYLPTDHPDMGGSYNNIGLVYASIGHHDIALENYNRALEIKLKSLPPHHPELAMTYANIGLVYSDKREFKQALPYLQKAEAIFRRTLPPQHPSIIKTEQIITHVLMFCIA